MKFHNLMGKAILEVFYEKGIKNTGQLNLIEEEADYLFENELLIENANKE